MVPGLTLFPTRRGSAGWRTVAAHHPHPAVAHGGRRLKYTCTQPMIYGDELILLLQNYFYKRIFRL